MQLEEKTKAILNLFKAGRFDEVISKASVLNKKFPNQPIFYNILSLTYQAKVEYEKSVKILEKGLKLFRNNIHFLNNLGLTYYKSGDLKKAKELFERCLDVDSKNIEVLNNLALLNFDLNKIKDASILYKKSLELNNNVLQTNYNYASLLQSIGKYDEAKIFLNKALLLNENFTLADQAFSQIHKYKKNDPHIEIMKNKIKNLKLSNFQLSQLYFALGKSYSDIKEYDKSFENIEYGNKLKKEIFNFNIKDEVKYFNIIKSKFENLKNKNIISNKHDIKIIFILGMPRSGTSLVEQIISSHKMVYGCGEIKYLSEYFHNFVNKENNEDELNLYKEKYTDYLKLLEPNSKIFTDKAPLNFKWIGFIKKIFPHSKIIHCKRNSLENCWSIFKNDFKNQLNFSYSLNDIADYYKIYKDLISFWKNNFSREIYEINYENLVKDTESETKKLIEFCELKWDENCLKFFDNERPIKTVSFHQVRKPVYKESLNASKVYNKYLTKLDKILNPN